MSKALVVDDSRAMRGILSKILIHQGFEVCTASDGPEALKALHGEASDITLMCADYNMPDMNGVELIGKMRLIPGMMSVPVIMVTTETHLSSMQAAFRAGANEYVMKPFTSDMLLDKLCLLGLCTREDA